MNYNPESGKELNKPNKKITLTNNQITNCTECKTHLNPKENYCPHCGKLNARTEQNIEPQPSIQQNTREKFTLKQIDYKRILLSISLTIILTSIFLALFNREVNSILLPSKFKLFFTKLSLINVASINFSFESQLVNIGTISLAPRIIIYPLISMLLIYISTKITFNKEGIKQNTIYHSISYAVIYALIMVVIGTIGSYTIYLGEGEVFKVKIGLISLFVNSLMIGFVGSYLAMYKYEVNNTIDDLISKSLKVILIGYGVTALILCIVSYSKLTSDYNLNKEINYLLGDSKFYIYLIIIVLLLVVASWLFALSNFATITMFGLVNYNIISLTKELSMPIILFSIIPAVLLIIIGRKLKTKYGNNQIRLICRFSGIYSLFMCGFAYFTRILIKINAPDIISEIRSSIYDEFGYFGYYYGDVISGYIDQLNNKLSSGVYIGINGFVMLITAFIFSFVFVYIGYKTKKIDKM